MWKILNRQRLGLVLKVFSALSMFVVGHVLLDMFRDTRRALEIQRRDSICPSYLSIARSSRDTLIVMRNDTLCMRYVLDSLK